MASLRRATSIVSRLISSSAAPIRPSFGAARLPPSQSFCRYLSTSAGEGFDVDLSNEESRRKLFNRLLYRSKQRGFLELDLVLGKWVDENIHDMDEAGIRSLVDVLDLENPDLWKWVSGQESPPEVVEKNPVFCTVRGKVLDNLNSYSAPDTRAVPGGRHGLGAGMISREQETVP